MEQSLLVSVVLFCSGVLAAPQVEDRWYFPDQLEALTHRPASFEFFRPNPDQMNGRPRPGGRKATTTTTSPPPPEVQFQIPNCKCPSPPQYNPVCGTDGISYVNAQFLECARRCGRDVRIRRLGACKINFSVDRK